MNFKKTISIFLALAAACLTTGCIEKQDARNFTPFEAKELDACLVVTIDLSGSFSRDWQADGKAYRLFTNLISQFFNNGIGTDSRLIIGQISDSGDMLLFDGTATEFSQKFHSPETFNQFLASNSDPAGSKVYESFSQVLSYTNSIPEAGPSTRIMLVSLSDLLDNDANFTDWDDVSDALETPLSEFASRGGGIAMYFVDRNEKPKWQSFLQSAGFKPGTFAIETGLVESPQLPSFD